MNVLFQPPRITPEEFERMPDTKRFELIDGRLKEKGAGAHATSIQCELGFLLKLWVRSTRLGVVFDSECIHRCFPSHPERYRKPDVSFVRWDRMPAGEPPVGVFLIRPDFAAEVVSPTDSVYELNENLADYRDADIPLVWVVHPNIREVTVYRPGETPLQFTGDDVLTGDPVFPGFRVRVSELFQLQPPTAS